MSSVISFEKCPICGQEEALYMDFNVRTQEERCSCNICGFRHDYCYPRDEAGNIIQPAKRQEFESFGAGVINVKYKDSETIRMITVPQGTTEGEVGDKMDEIVREENVEEIYATWFNADTKEVKRLESGVM